MQAALDTGLLSAAHCVFSRMSGQLGSRGQEPLDAQMHPGRIAVLFYFFFFFLEYGTGVCRRKDLL